MLLKNFYVYSCAQEAKSSLKHHITIASVHIYMKIYVIYPAKHTDTSISFKTAGGQNNSHYVCVL